MNVSVAMTTYNGEKYLEEQLVSLLKQTREIDEVIICDDGSIDNTIKIAEEFIIDNKLKNKWKIVKNKSNKGYVKNFIDCANITRGDIIFFCDQDDIWDENKVKYMTEEFEKNSKITALTCTYKYIDTKGNVISSFSNKLEQQIRKIRKISLNEQINKNSSCGMVLATRRELFNKVYPNIIKYNLSFDLPIGIISASQGGYYKLGIPLAYRRVHENNTSQPKTSVSERIKDIEYHIRGREGRIKDLKAYIKILENDVDKKQLKLLEETLKSLENALLNLKNLKIRYLVVDLFRFNPMINKKICIMNLLCALYKKYIDRKE